jgi:hypothetical protein
MYKDYLSRIAANIAALEEQLPSPQVVHVMLELGGFIERICMLRPQDFWRLSSCDMETGEQVDGERRLGCASAGCMAAGQRIAAALLLLCHLLHTLPRSTTIIHLSLAVELATCTVRPAPYHHLMP